MKTLFLEKRKKNEEETNNEKIASTTLYRQNMSINYPRISVVTICYLNIPSRKEKGVPFISEKGSIGFCFKPNISQISSKLFY